MAKLETPKGIMHYTPIPLYPGINKIKKEVAFNNLCDVARVLEKYNIPLTPCFGTLLGIIRDHDFIDWDEDIDLFILIEDKSKLLEALWDMKEIGFDFVREDRCYHTLSVMRNDEYIDFNIMESVSPELRTDFGGGFFFEKHLTELIDWDFKGLFVKIPKEYEEYLTFMYGDWKTPVQYNNYSMTPWQIKKSIFRHKIKKLLPLSLRFKLLKKYHKKDFDKFLAKCKQEGVVLKYKINW